MDDTSSFVIADIPGLIEGAAEGAGLGHRFLKHLQRTGLLLHIVDIAPFDPDVDPVREARAIVAELEKYDAELHGKPRWLVLNKLDMLPEEERDLTVSAFLEAYGWPKTQPDDSLAFDVDTPRVFAISALTHEGTRELVRAIDNYLRIMRARARAAAEEAERQAEEARLARKAAARAQLEAAEAAKAAAAAAKAAGEEN